MNRLIQQERPPAGLWMRIFIALFVALFMLTLSFPHPYIPDLPGFFGGLFEPVVKWVGDHVFGIKKPYAYEILSDSTGLYIHLFMIVVFSIILTPLVYFLGRDQPVLPRALDWFKVLVAYYLAFYMIVYGFNKVFKWQFYLPETNLLFTRLGDMHRDMLYWSTMGTSHSYNVFLGIGEGVAAILLLIRRTRAIGALLAAAMMINVVMINFSFDISVKVFSLFLLLLATILLYADRRRWGPILAGKPVPASVFVKPAYLPVRKRGHRVFKALVILCMVASPLSSYIESGNFNDDRAPRPPFHGAYAVMAMQVNGDSLQHRETNPLAWKHVFVHRRGYLIIQFMNEKMKDFLFESDTLTRTWVLEDGRTGEKTRFHYQRTGNNEILLTGNAGGQSLSVQLQTIDWRKMTLFRREFNWTMD